MLVGLKITLDNHQLLYDKTKLRAIFRAAGSEVLALAKRKIRTAPGGGRVYYGSGGTSKAYGSGYKPGRHVASRPGDPPVSNTGFLVSSLKLSTYRNGLGVVMSDRAFAGKILEVGGHGGGPSGRIRGVRQTKAERKATRKAVTARVLLPRPYLSVALMEREASIKARILASITRDIKFVKVKATAKV